MNTDYNLAIVLLSYFISVAGAFTALITTRQAIESVDKTRQLMLSITAAVALGGVGIWSMHFIGMLALSIPDVVINYHIGITLLSLAIAIVFVFIGLFLVCKGMPNVPSLLPVGFIVGTGITAMHYSGMMAMRGVNIDWNIAIVIVSYIIAIVAATVALWLAAHLTKRWHMIISAFAMGIAVCGMHYTGMYAAQFTQLLKPKSNQINLFSLNEWALIGLITLGALFILVMVIVVNIFISNESSDAKTKA